LFENTYVEETCQVSNFKVQLLIKTFVEILNSNLTDLIGREK